MASLKQKVLKIMGREFIAGKVYRVDMDRVDVLPNGSTGILRSLPLTGDRDKVKPGDEVKIITVAGERVALVEDIALASSEVEAVAALTEDQQTLLAKIGGGGIVSAPTPGQVSEASYYVSDWRLIEGAAYASAATITLPKDVTSRITKGAKIRIVQSGTDKYFYCVGASYSAETLLTTLTLAGGQDYSVANAAIEEFAYSTMQAPQGFPEWFVFASSWTTTGAQPSVGNATGRAYFKIEGTLVTWMQFITWGSTTTYGTGSWRFSMPAPAYTDGGVVCYFGMGRAYDSSANLHYDLLVQINYANTYLTYFLPTHTTNSSAALTGAAPFAWAGSDQLGWQIQYRI